MLRWLERGWVTRCPGCSCLPSCGLERSREGACSMTAGDPQNPALSWHPEIFVQGNLDVADEIVAPDFVWHAPGLPETPLGPEGVKRLATAYRAALGIVDLVDEDPLTQGDRTVYRWILRATHQGELLGIPPTGKQIEVT